MDYFWELSIPETSNFSHRFSGSDEVGMYMLAAHVRFSVLHGCIPVC
jgi:hypothetical protein